MTTAIVKRASWALLVLAAAMIPVMQAQAQQMLAAGTAPYDKVRFSGFIWRGKPTGTVEFAGLGAIPGFEQGIDVTDELGFDEPQNGWILEGNVAPGRKHHLLFTLSRLEADGRATISFPGFGSVPAFTVSTDSEINLQEFHIFYNYLFVARPQVEFGLLAGVGRFDANAGLLTNVGSARAGLQQAFPSIGGNLLLNPRGPVRGYLEITGFPKVEVEDLSGWQLDLTARVEVFPVRNFGVIVGYRRYHLVFNDADDALALDLGWNGFTFGAQVRY